MEPCIHDRVLMEVHTTQRTSMSSTLNILFGSMRGYLSAFEHTICYAFNTYGHHAHLLLLAVHTHSE